MPAEPKWRWGATQSIRPHDKVNERDKETFYVYENNFLPPFLSLHFHQISLSLSLSLSTPIHLTTHAKKASSMNIREWCSWNNVKKITEQSQWITIQLMLRRSNDNDDYLETRNNNDDDNNEYLFTSCWENCNNNHEKLMKNNKHRY